MIIFKDSLDFIDAFLCSLLLKLRQTEISPRNKPNNLLFIAIKLCLKCFFTSPLILEPNEVSLNFDGKLSWKQVDILRGAWLDRFYAHAPVYYAIKINTTDKTKTWFMRFSRPRKSCIFVLVAAASNEIFVFSLNLDYLINLRPSIRAYILSWEKGRRKWKRTRSARLGIFGVEGGWNWPYFW